MFLQKSLEKKLNETLKEYTIISDEKNGEKPKEAFFPHNHKKLDPNKNYPKELRIFNSDDVSVPAKKAKEYIRDFKDPDILELHQKRWDNSSRPNYNFRSELKKTLFEVRHGLKDVNMVKLKPKIVELGCDTREIAYYGWNNSCRIENEEKKSLDFKNLEASYINSVKKWKTVEKNIFEGNSNSYNPPYSITKDMNNILRSLKKSSHDEREAIKKIVQYEFPAASPEKIAAISFQRMSPKLIYNIKEKQGKNIDYYQPQHLDMNIARQKKVDSINKVKTKNTLTYGIDNGKTFKSNANSVPYNSKNSIIRMKELNNSRDKTFIKADFIQTSNSTQNRRQMALSSMDKVVISETIPPTLNIDDKRKYLNSIREANPWLNYEYAHPGKWTKLATEKDENIIEREGDNRIEAWSCCISTEKNSKGCTRKVNNKMKWVYDSFI